MLIPILLIVISWFAFILYWAISALRIKRDVPSPGQGWWSGRALAVRFAAALIVLIVVAIRVATGGANYRKLGLIFGRGIYTPSLMLVWAAAALSVIGVGFAIWARAHLGRNWSPHPAVKEHPELVTTGPYAFVRHPIYSGMILMALGAALTGTFFGFAVFLIACIFLIWRINKEESIMLQLFPNEYPTYQARTKRLIPFVW